MRVVLKWKGFPSDNIRVEIPQVNGACCLAELIHGSEDGVVFDGAGFGPGGALVASRPVEVLSGGWGEWEVLAEALRSGQESGRPGGLAGWFDYEGNFRFGVFPAWMRADFPWPDAWVPPGSVDFRPTIDPAGWVRRVQRIRGYIAAGDVYQANLTHALTARWSPPPGAFYTRLRAASPAPYSCFLRLGDTAVLSASPECFLRIDGRRITTKPVKGTRPRGADAHDDEALARELVSSAKERAELVMITDLERNDLGQVCEYGSVRADILCRLESFAHVHHLVSTVEGVLRQEVSPLQAVRACFPGGSITGAPKRRAREIIAELEGAPRGIYTGAIGYLGWDGTAVFNIAIRTLILRDGLASFGIGAGIVADSDPLSEYEETLHKAAGLLAAAG